jgi:FKBP-type peptidyl-prolyl cis-trans isomerase
MADHTTTVVKKEKLQSNPSFEYSDHEKEKQIKTSLKARDFNDSFSDDDDSSDVPRKKKEPIVENEPRKEHRVEKPKNVKQDIQRKKTDNEQGQFDSRILSPFRVGDTAEVLQRQHINPEEAKKFPRRVEFIPY